jgi:hypothetical protein
MIYKEEVRDLFSVPADYYLAHCISADFKMGAGIAVEFEERFHTKTLLMAEHPWYFNEWRQFGLDAGDCIVQGKVLNLITKERYFHKPTYMSMYHALLEMKSACDVYAIEKVAMPCIGSGLDRLQWSKVSQMIQNIFADDDIEILVCRQ